jgi:hypothetical protein
MKVYVVFDFPDVDIDETDDIVECLEDVLDSTGIYEEGYVWDISWVEQQD